MSKKRIDMLQIGTKAPAFEGMDENGNRMMDDNYNYLHYGTRVKVVDVVNGNKDNLTSIRYIKTTLDDKEEKANGTHQIRG